VVDATTRAAVETGLPPAMMPFPLRRQPLAAEIASQRDDPNVGVVADVVAARAVDAVVGAKDARIVTL